jgi:hypothetical protein
MIITISLFLIQAKTIKALSETNQDLSRNTILHQVHTRSIKLRRVMEENLKFTIKGFQKLYLRKEGSKKVKKIN